MIYFDNSATTRVDADVAEVAMQVMIQNFGNPSSLHSVGAQAYQALGIARNQIAKMLGAKTDRIFFTSGGTEGNNLVIQGGGLGKHGTGKHIVTTAVEHSSILSACGEMERRGYSVTYVKPRPDSGRICADDVIAAVNEHTALVSCMTVNSETGELLPLKEIIRGVREKNPHTQIHTDCVQGFGKIPFKLHEYDVDYLTASAHKIHGPKGVGALYIKEGIGLQPLLFGGSQEGGIRPGTESVPLACAFGYATDKLLPEIQENFQQARELQGYLIEQLRMVAGVRLTMTEGMSPFIVNFSIPGIPSHRTVEHFNLKGIYIAAGSACSRGEPSHVIAAMGLPQEVMDSVIRVSLCKYSTKAEVTCFVETLRQFLS